MTRTEAIQALRERFEETDAVAVMIYREQAEALGVFDQADDDGWIEWNACPGARSPFPNDTGFGYADIKLADGEVVDAVYCWDDTPYEPRRVVAYRIKRED